VAIRAWCSIERIGPDRNAIQALVDMLSRAPEGWEKYLDAFAANPSVEAWDVPFS
jgi:hypothetical protein